MRIIQSIIIIFLFASFTRSQSAENNLVLSGNLKTDAKIVSDNYVDSFCTHVIRCSSGKHWCV